MKLTQGIILGFCGRTQDRFATYQEPLTVEQKLRLAASVPGVECVEIVHPYETADTGELTVTAKAAGLGFAAVNANIKGEPHFAAGSASRPDPLIRGRAVEILKTAKDMAARIGAPLVTCCPLTDGYDYLFQADYAAVWKNLVGTFAEAASYRPEIPLFAEYKYSEARVNCFLDSASTALLLCRDAAVSGLGVTIDFGHALYAGENPARSLCMVAEAGVPFYLHSNDNDGRFDWDLAAGSRNLLAYAEFLFYTREYGYNRCLTTDASPRALDAAAMFTRHVSLTAALWKLVDGLDRTAWRKLMREEQTGMLMELVQRQIYRL